MKNGKSKAVLPTKVENKNHLEVTGLYAVLRGFRHPDCIFRGEYHASWELVYVIKGHMEASADDRVYELKSGDMILHKPMEFHTLKTLGKSSAEILIITFSMDGGLSHELKNKVFHPAGSALSALKMLMETLDKNGSKESLLDSVDYLVVLGAALPKQLVFTQLEAFLLMLLYTESATLPTVKNEASELYSKIVEILEENVYGWIPISEIARKCNRSESTIKSCFKNYTGCGIHKYLLKIKMRTAIKLLHSGMSVGQVSEALGFEDANYFSTVFKREIGSNATSYK